MSLARAVSLFAALVLMLIADGCWFHGPGEIRDRVSRSTGNEYEQEIGLTLGRTSMAIARFGLRLADEEQIPLKGVRKVQVGIYQVRDIGAPSDIGTSILSGSFPEWSPVVRMHEDGESVLVMVREKKDKVRAMLVIVDDADELVIVRMIGNLERMLKEAMRFGFEQADRPDLYDSAVENAEWEYEG